MKWYTFQMFLEKHVMKILDYITENALYVFGIANMNQLKLK